MAGRLMAAFKRWREKQRQYQIQRALYKQGGGAGPPSSQANLPVLGPPAATHDADISKLADDD
jgi:hypothetical protein